MKIKEGVKVDGLKDVIIVILPEIAQLFKLFGLEFVITSAVEGTHMEGSKHPKGLAIDVRLPYKDMSWNYNIVSVLQIILGKNYDVVLEKNHIHIEFDIK